MQQGKKGKAPVAQADKVIHVELLNDAMCSVKFGDKFFDQEVVKVLKGLPGSKYEAANKEWVLGRDKLEQYYSVVATQCIAKGIKIMEIPEFVMQLTKNPVPYSLNPPHTVFGPRLQLLRIYEEEKKHID